MERRGTQFSPRDIYPNASGIPSTFEYTQPESAEQVALYDADGNSETIADMRGAANGYSVWIAVAAIVVVVVLGGLYGIK